MPARSIQKLVSLVFKAVRGRPAAKKVLNEFARNQLTASQVVDAVTSKAGRAKFSDKQRKLIAKIISSPQAQNTAGFKPLTRRGQLARIGRTITPRSPERADVRRIVKGFVPQRQVAPSSTPAAGRGGLRLSSERARTRRTITAGKLQRSRASVALDVNTQLLEQLSKSKRGRFIIPALGVGAGLLIGGAGAANRAPDEAAAKSLIAELILSQGQRPDRKALVQAQTELTKTRTLVLLSKILGQANAVSPAIPFT